MQFINEAEKMATKSIGKFIHGCVCVSGGKIVSKGHNRFSLPHRIQCFEKGRQQLRARL